MRRSDWVRDARWVRWLARGLCGVETSCGQLVGREQRLWRQSGVGDGSQLDLGRVGSVVSDSGQEAGSSQRPCCCLVSH